jgi:hypothetical protein
MIEPTDTDIGRDVIYDPPFKGAVNGRGEHGIITSFNDRFVFVRYGADTFSKATVRQDLEWADA